MAQYVENSISGNDLIAFFCEDKGDSIELTDRNWHALTYNAFMRYLTLNHSERAVAHPE